MGENYFFASFTSLDGSIQSSSYKFSQILLHFYDLILIKDYIVLIAGGDSCILLFNTITSVFEVKTCNNKISLNEISLEKSSGRLIVTGQKTTSFNIGYISKFPFESMIAHPDLSSSNFKVSKLQLADYEIIQENKKIFSKLFTVNTFSEYINTIETKFSVVLNNTSDVYYQTQDQVISVLKSSNVKVTPDLPCSSSGTTAISYSIVEYNKIPLQGWISINPNSGELTMITPDVPANTEFDFNISSSIAGVLSPVLKHIKLVVKFCKVAN